MGCRRRDSVSVLWSESNDSEVLGALLLACVNVPFQYSVASRTIVKGFCFISHHDSKTFQYSVASRTMVKVVGYHSSV